MKIALFTNSYLPYLSGISIAVKSLKDSLEKLGHTIFVVAPKYPGHKEIDPQILGFPSLPAPYPGYRFVLPFSIEVYKKLKQEKIDLVHCHQPFGVGLASLIFARYLKIPFVYTYHTLFPRYVHHLAFVPQKFTKWLATNYLTFFCNQVDTIIAPSEMVRRYLVLTKVKKPIAVIPTGLTLSSNEPACRQAGQRATSNKQRLKYGIPLNAKLLLYTGRLAPEKNIEFLLSVFPRIKEQQENTYLLLIGSGPTEKHYREMAKKIDPTIIFTGQLSHNEVVECCTMADVFVFASITETQGLVLCEAKAAGLPIVALFGGGIADVVRSGIDGYIVPRNKDKFVEHVVRLLKDDVLREQMGKKAREDVLVRFASNSVAKRIETVYNHLINQRREMSNVKI